MAKPLTGKSCLDRIAYLISVKRALAAFTPKVVFPDRPAFQGGLRPPVRKAGKRKLMLRSSTAKGRELCRENRGSESRGR